MSTSTLFKDEATFEKRRELAQRILTSYPDRIPVIVEKAANSDLPDLDRKKFLAPAEIQVSKFNAEIRKHLKVPSEKAIWLFVGASTFPQQNQTMQQLYERYKDDDGFLYITYSAESVFG